MIQSFPFNPLRSRFIRSLQHCSLSYFARQKFAELTFILSQVFILDYVTPQMFRKLEQEKSSLPFDPNELSYILSGGKKEHERFQELLRTIPATWDPNAFNLSREDQIKLSIKALVKINKHINLEEVVTLTMTMFKNQFETAGTIHMSMFIPCIKILGSDPQGERLLEKCRTFEIIGCYAQTELGHGSDVQNLETTAELDLETDEFIVNTPNIAAAKYWPGDLGIYANWALVFAKMIIKGVNLGVQSFLVQIRDENGQPLPGIQVGDLGPKFGFHTKDNGYLIMKNVRTHRKNMLRRYAKVEKDGSFTLRGNQKISYATMMLIRKLISAMSPKYLGLGVTIAGRYSFARKQFKNDKKEQIPIIDYQLQQNKIISCIADYYAITINGLKVSKMADDNYINVSQHDDDSMMKETHNCLCLTKAFNSELTMRGLEVCRLACGGHGFSQYSGLPHLVHAYSASVTYEGENTVMYLQVARYLMKAYKYTLTKKKELDPSVSYFNNLGELLGKKCSVTGGWTLNDIKTLLAQAIYYYVSSVGEKMLNDAVSQKDIWNYQAGLRLHQSARGHACYWTFEAFADQVQKIALKEVKTVMERVCLLFGINSVFENVQALVESGVLAPNHVTSLKQKKQELLRQLRPVVSGLIEGIGMSQQLRKSDIVKGDIYKNLYERAKQNPLNKQDHPSVDIIKRGITNTRPRL